MAADNIVKDAIRDVLKGGSVRRLLEVGFYNPVSSEPLRFIVYSIRALHRRGRDITPRTIVDYLIDHTTKGTAKAAKEELYSIL